MIILHHASPPLTSPPLASHLHVPSHTLTPSRTPSHPLAGATHHAVHRAIFGSLERFFGVLIESTAGDFPLWLAPTQLRLLPVSDDFLPYCAEVKAMAKKVSG